MTSVWKKRLHVHATETETETKTETETYTKIAQIEAMFEHQLLGNACEWRDI